MRLKGKMFAATGAVIWFVAMGIVVLTSGDANTSMPYTAVAMFWCGIWCVCDTIERKLSKNGEG